MEKRAAVIDVHDVHSFVRLPRLIITPTSWYVALGLVPHLLFGLFSGVMLHSSTRWRTCFEPRWPGVVSVAALLSPSRALRTSESGEPLAGYTPTLAFIA